MNVLTRGVRNAFRNGIRSFSIVIILGLSIGMVLSMLVARQAVEQKITEVKGSVGNTISVSPAGMQGFEGGGEPLTSGQVNSLTDIDHVISVASTLSDRLTSDTTNLESAVEAGSLGQRFAGNDGAQPQAPLTVGGEATARSFTPPVRVTGTNSVANANVYGGSGVTFTSGEAFDSTVDDAVAVIGKGLAEKNSLRVGSTFTAYGTEVRVVGIYDTGTDFANNNVVMPLSTLQRLSSQTDTITAATVTVDSLDNLAATTEAVKAKLGTAADVTNSQDVATTAVEPLENVKSIAMFSLIAALVAGGVIILLTMVMIVRERRREIGVMKAIGSGNAGIMGQFVVESVTLTLIGLVVGLGIALVAATPLTNTLVTSSSASTQSAGTGGMRRGPGGMGAAIGVVAGQNLRSVQTSVGIETFAFGVGAAVLIAVIGSAVPAYFISKIRPSEVMRAE